MGAMFGSKTSKHLELANSKQLDTLQTNNNNQVESLVDDVTSQRKDSQIYKGEVFLKQ